MQFIILFIALFTTFASAIPLPFRSSHAIRRHALLRRADGDTALSSIAVFPTMTLVAASSSAPASTSNIPAPTGSSSSAGASTFSVASSSSLVSSTSTPSASPAVSSSGSASASSGAAQSSVTASASSVVPSASPSASPASGGGKLVVAHMMVGNTFLYTVDSWKADIELANSVGIDGFALNIGTDVWQPGHVDDAYEAAKQSGLDFKLFFSFDMSVFPCSAPEHATVLRNYITSFADHPNQLKIDGKSMASTFAGEACTFGQGSVPDGWRSQFTRHSDLSGASAVHFVPSFFGEPSQFTTFNDVMDGSFNFNSGWPITLTADAANSFLGSVGSGLSLKSATATAATQVSDALSKFVGATDTDKQHVDALAAMGGSKKTYMAAVSPWFFTHYSPQTFNKNFIYLADSHLYPTRWESLVDTRAEVDIVEIVTWNDYGESHYLRDPGADGSQPNSQAWVDGLSHAGWLDMTSYYARAFKEGALPAVDEDKLYMWARPHTKDADAPDGVGKPDNFELTEDLLWAVVFAKEPSTVTLTPADGAAQTFEVPAGVTKLSMPLAAGQTMRGTLARGGSTVVDVNPEFTFDGAPKTYNYNAFVAFGAAKSS